MVEAHFNVLYLESFIRIIKGHDSVASVKVAVIIDKNDLLPCISEVGSFLAEILNHAGDHAQSVRR